MDHREGMIARSVAPATPPRPQRVSAGMLRDTGWRESFIHLTFSIGGGRARRTPGATADARRPRSGPSGLVADIWWAPWGGVNDWGVDPWLLPHYCADLAQNGRRAALEPGGVDAGPRP